jgi:CubicO group peptidase (beta-lactamase class C family)
VTDLAAVDELARSTGFSGVVRLDVEGEVRFEAAYGLADRRWGVPVGTGTRFGIASGTKGLTALAVLALVARGTLALSTTARSLLGPDLPLVDDAVTVEQLLAHRSGIGDYLDESAVASVDEYVMPVPVHRLAATEDYLPVLDGHPQVSAPGERFRYNNGGYVLLALLAERASGAGFHDLVDRLVGGPAGLADTGFPRSDELPPGAATGYLDGTGARTNVLHLPVRGSGDGGAYSTAADVHRLWDAVTAGRVVPPELVAAMTAPRSTGESGGRRYGLGVWIDGGDDDVLGLTGSDAGCPSARCTTAAGAGRGRCCPTRAGARGRSPRCWPAHPAETKVSRSLLVRHLPVTRTDRTGNTAPRPSWRTGAPASWPRRVPHVPRRPTGGRNRKGCG